MTDEKLLLLVQELRWQVQKEREMNSERAMDIFFVNLLDMVCCLVELGVKNNLPISIENEYWFQGSYNLNFWQPDLERNLYSPIVGEVVKRSFFRNKP